MYGPLKNLHKASWKQTFALVGIIILALIVGYAIASSQDYYRAVGKDFISLWLAPRLLLEGKSPYNPNDWIPAHTLYGAQWVSDDTFLYPLPLAVILLPLGLLPLEYASVLWVALSILGILLTYRIFLRIWHRNWSGSYDIPALAGIFCFRPVAVTLWLGQMDWLILLCLTAGVFYWEKRKWLLGAMIMALSVIKPQLGIPLLAFVSLWLIFRRMWVVLIGEGITIGSLFMLGWFVDHAWLLRWIGIGRFKVESFYCCTPTSWGMASLLCKFNQNCAFTVGRVLAVVLFGIMLAIILRMRVGESKFVIGLSIPIALVISPYLWTYSHVVLVVSILISMELMKQCRWPYLLVAPYTLYIALLSGLIVLLSIRVGVDVLSALIPTIVFVILWLLYRFTQDGGRVSSTSVLPMRG